MLHLPNNHMFEHSASNELEEGYFRLRFLFRLRARTRIGEGAGAAKTVGWPGDVRCGTLPTKKKFPAFGGGMLRNFELVLDLNRPSQPRLSDLPWELQIVALCAFEVEVGQAGVTDG